MGFDEGMQNNFKTTVKIFAFIRINNRIAE